MHYIKIAKAEHYKAGDYTVHSVIGKKIALFCRDSMFKAMEITCKHQGALLLTELSGRLEEDRITCPRHGWQYDISSGECLSNDSAPLKEFPVEIRDGYVFIGFDMG